jgi:organic radical activating enzyme
MSPSSRNPNAGTLLTVDSLTAKILAEINIEGITISGGEPFLQYMALLNLLRQLREKSTLSVIIYTGYYLSDLFGKNISEINTIIEKYSDIIIQTTPLGMYPRDAEDPIEFYKFSGREIVMDIIYQPEKTRCLTRAEEAGCRILNGHDMLLRQARYQYACFMNKEFPPSLVSRVGF